MKEILEFNIINFDFFKITILSLIKIILTILPTIFLAYFLKKGLLNKKLQRYVNIDIRKKITFVLQLLIWLAAISIIIEMNTEHFYEYQFLKNKYLKITTLRILSALFAISINLLIIYSLRIAQRRMANYNNNFGSLVYNFYKFFQIILWITTISIILKSILIDYSKLIDFNFFTISKTPITLGDFIFAGIVIIVGQIIILSIKSFFESQVKREKIDIGTSHSIYRILKYLIWIILIGIILEISGFQLSILLAGSAALLVGLGFGIQQLFSDFVSGFVIIAEGAVKVGDIIELNNEITQVAAANLRTTELLTRDGDRIIIPNTQLTSNNITNKTKDQDITRTVVQVGVAYGSDIELVENLLLESLEGHHSIEKEPAPYVLFTNFGNSSLDFELFFWTTNAFEMYRTKSDIRKIIVKKFRENNITIPFPQTDVHFYKH